MESFVGTNKLANGDIVSSQPVTTSAMTDEQSRIGRLASVAGPVQVVPGVSPVKVLVYNVRTSQRTERSQLSSIFASRRGLLDRTGFNCRQWLFLSVEMFLSYAWWVIEERSLYIVDLNREGQSQREGLISYYLKRANGSFISLLAGYLADTYFNMYSLAIFNVVLHTVGTGVLFLESIVRDDDRLLYQNFFFEFYGILLIPLKATDFARLVYGLGTVGRKNMRAIILFIFCTELFNERAMGGLLVTITSRLEFAWELLVRLAFMFSFITLVVWIYAFKPSKDKFEVNLGPVGNQFIGCIVTAVWTRYKLRAYLRSATTKTTNWLDLAEIKYNKIYVARARNLLRIYILIVPTIGFSLYMAPKTYFYQVLWHRLEPTGFFLMTGVMEGASIVVMLTMGLVQFVLIPLARLVGLQKRYLSKFIIGYIFAVICMLYTTILLNSLEENMPDPSTGMIRIFNARDDPVRVISDDKSMSMFDHLTQPANKVEITLTATEPVLFRVMMHFKETNLITYLAVEPDVTVGYVLLEPATVLRMGEKLPIREMESGVNNPHLPKLYIFNALSTKVSVELRAGSSHVYTINPGSLEVTQVPEGVYELRTLEFASSGTNNITLIAGGFFGIISHANSLEPLLTTDTVTSNKREDTIYMLGVCIPYGIAVALAYVTLRGVVYFNTPEGMEGLSFGFLSFIDGATNWIIWIGHKTWHPFISSEVLSIYTITELVLMFCSIFVFIKFEDWYTF